MNVYLPWNEEELTVLGETYREIRVRQGGSWKDAATFMRKEMRKRGGPKRREYTVHNTKARWRKLKLEDPSLFEGGGMEEDMKDTYPGEADEEQSFIDDSDGNSALEKNLVTPENRQNVPGNPLLSSAKSTPFMANGVENIGLKKNQVAHETTPKTPRNPVLPPVRSTARGGINKTTNGPQVSSSGTCQQTKSADERYDEALNNFFAYGSARSAVEPGWSEKRQENLKGVALRAGDRVIAERRKK